MPQSFLTQANTFRFLELLRPMRALNTPKVRLGRDSDGGYVMLNNFSTVKAAYSIGIRDDVSWDIDVAGYGIPVFTYDHTIDRLPVSHPKFHWRKVGLAPFRRAAEELDSLKNLLSNNGHEAANDLVLKCDIEGSEWAVFATTSSQILAQFSQIVIEFHGLSHLKDVTFANVAIATILNLSKTHHVIHVHGNTHGGLCLLGGIVIPETLEITFARKSDFVFKESDEIFPTPLDRSCRSDVPDYYLGHFEFRMLRHATDTQEPSVRAIA